MKAQGRAGNGACTVQRGGKMQMKTNEKPLFFMFQVPNYA